MKLIKKIMAHIKCNLYGIAIFEKYRLRFQTIDNTEHQVDLNWLKVSDIIIKPETYLMNYYHDQQYIKDNDGNYYPWYQIKKCWFELTDKKVLFDRTKEFQMFFNREEIKKLDEYTDRIRDLL